MALGLVAPMGQCVVTLTAQPFYAVGASGRCLERREKKDMSENQVSVPATSEVIVPDYLNNFEGATGVESLSEFVKPPRMKIVQKQAGDALLENYSVGDVILTPANSLMVSKNEPVSFAPIFFFPEWCTWAPYELKDTMDAILERTVDPNDPLVRKCRNPKLREEPCPGNEKYMVRHCEHLNYVVLVLDGPAAGTTAVMSFFRAQHQDGTNFAQLIKMRKSGVPLYAMQFELKSYNKQYGGNSWWGLRVQNPQGMAPFATAEEFEVRKSMFEELSKAHESGAVSVDFSDDTVEGTATSASSKF